MKQNYTVEGCIVLRLYSLTIYPKNLFKIFGTFLCHMFGRLGLFSLPLDTLLYVNRFDFQVF